MFRQQNAATLELHQQRERLHALTLATMGVDYPYTYPGAPFGPEVFAAAPEGFAAAGVNA